MNRGLRIGLIVVVVLALAYPAAAWIIGKSVEHQVVEREKFTLDQFPYLKVVKRDYRRGVYTSTEEVTYQLGGNLLQTLQAAGHQLGQGGQSPQITLRHTIHHGPLPQLRTLAPATVDTEFVLPPDVQKSLSGLVSDQAHLTIHTQMKWSGGGTVFVHSTPFKKDLPNQGQLEWRGLDATLDEGRELGTQVLDLHAPGFVVKDPTSSLTVENLKITTDIHRVFEQLNAGKVRLSLERIALDSPVKGGLHNLTLQADSSVSGDFLDTDGTFSIDSLESPSFSATQLVWEIKLDHIHGPSAASLTQEVRAIQAEQLQGPVPSDPSDPAAIQRQVEAGQKYATLFQTQGVQILAHEPLIEMPRMGFKTPDGELMLSLKLQAPGLKPADVSGDIKTLVLTLTKFLQITVNARIDSTLFDKLLQQTLPESDKSDPVKARMQQLENVGYIKVDGNALTTLVTFMGGQLKINGQQFNPAAFAPPQPTPPGPKAPAPKSKRLPH